MFRQSNISVYRLAPVAVVVVLLMPFVVTGLSASSSKASKFSGGAGVGRLVLDDKAGQENAWKCHYDMVLVERIQGRPPTSTGLFIPQENLPRLHLAKVIGVGPGREEENGRIAPTPPELQVGTYVIAKNPWGIGPKDEETADGKKLSYMRFQDVAAVIPEGLLLED